MRWSNRKIKSTMHRVCPPLKPAEGDYYPSRYSVAFFAGPNPETNIEALPGTWETEEEKLYPAVNARDFIGGGFKDLYGGENANNETAMAV
jgi:isopenicillin N synthase-like dioxygenase